MDKFQNSYRNSSSRLKNWDYRWNAAYFITICTQAGVHYFGKIKDDKMKFSEIGIIASILWYEIKNHSKDIDLGEFVIMPNHVHGILILNKNESFENRNFADDTNVGTLHATSLQPPQTNENSTVKNEFMSKISPKSGSVSTIIRSYKSAVSKYCHRLGFNSGWQSRFYEHIIRDEKSYDTISKYIQNNPSNWMKDKFNR